MPKRAGSIPVNKIADHFDTGIAIERLSFNDIPDSGKLNIPEFEQVKSAHREDRHSFFLLEKGTVQVEIDFQKYTIIAPSVIYMHPDQVHRILSLKDVVVSSWGIDNENLNPEYLKLLEDITPVKPLILTNKMVAVVSQAVSLCLTFADLRSQKLHHSLLKDSCNALTALVISQYLALAKVADKSVRSEVITKAFRELLEHHYTTFKVLISGASIAGLTAAYWMNKIGYQVTVVELANAPRMGGTAVDLRTQTLDVIRRMGIFEQLKSKALNLEIIEFKNTDDETENAISLKNEQQKHQDDEIEIERTSLISILFEKIKSDVEFVFGNSITVLSETKDNIQVTFKSGSERSFDLVFGCDGTHSGVRKIWFGEESEYSHFLEAYFSVTIVDKSLIKPNTMQFYNVPGKACMLN
ncbi:MAG: hypothetical protein EOP45_05525, partial [Sphingobacteriaceae bacterium]